MEKETAKTGKVNSSTLLPVIAVALLAALIFMLMQAAGVFGTSPTTVNTTLITVTDSLSATGYIFRQETVLTTDLTGPILYLTEDGDKVATNTELAILYQGSSAPASSLQEEISSLQTKIGFLEQSLGEGTNLSDIKSTRRSLQQTLLKVQQSLGEGNLMAALEQRNELLSYLTRYHTLTEDSGAAAEQLASLKESMEQLLTGYSKEGTGIYNATLYDPQGANPGSYSTDHGYEMPPSGIPEGSLSYAVGSGYFYRAERVDGYETIFTEAFLNSMTVSSFKEKIAGITESDVHPWAEGEQIIGKMVSTPEWKVVVPLDAGAIVLKNGYGDFTGWQIEREGFGNIVTTKNAKFEISFNEMPDRTVTMQLDDIRQSDDSGILLIFSTFEMPDSFSYVRAQTVRIRMQSVTGYQVPAAALREVDGTKGVYVRDGSKVAFRKITVLYEDNGYVIVETRADKQYRYELYRAALNEDMSEEEALKLLHEGDMEYRNYLNLNDQIIVEGSDLYDGKILG